MTKDERPKTQGTVTMYGFWSLVKGVEMTVAYEIDTDRLEAFKAHLASGGRVEATDWMPAVGGYPHGLRSGGWLYLRCDERLGARVRVPTMRWRHERPWRTGDDPGDNRGWGAGLVFGVDPSTWEAFDQALGEDAEWMRQGYRYHRTDAADVVHQLMKDDAISEGEWED